MEGEKTVKGRGKEGGRKDVGREVRVKERSNREEEGKKRGRGCGRSVSKEEGKNGNERLERGKKIK